MWCATHRIHHARSDQAGDPHSPLDGGWWSHLLWLFVRHDDKFRQALFRHYVPDLLQDRVLVFFDRTYGLWLFASGGLLYVLGGWPFLLWGLCVRMVVAYHSTWFVNSATHLWGYRNYETDDESKNLWWVALMSYGEGWHNNHHAHPRLARAGHKWWELDMTFYAIRVLQALRLAYAVDDRIPAARTAPATVAVEPAGAARTHSGTHVKG
jgi:stearoyl-CoA desaturase (delta-9 desaturase)